MGSRNAAASFFIGFEGTEIALNGTKENTADAAFISREPRAQDS
jgi:hypothetical protein